MNGSKAKKAVKKSSARKKQTEAQAADALLAMQAAGGGRINPEVQAGHVDLQPADGYVNPYHAMGPLAPTNYSAGNMLAGYNYPVAINPET
jgi:hypothetical protein